MSLADELLADLEENDHDEFEDTVDIQEDNAIKEETPDVKDYLMEQDTTQINSVRELCKLRDSAKLQNIVTQIEEYASRVRRAAEVIGPVEQDPEYQLIVEANNLAQDVDAEISK